MRKKIILFTILATFILLCSSCNNNDPQHTFTFTLLQTSDLHSHAFGYGPSLDYVSENDDDSRILGGYSRIASIIDRIRHEHAEEDNPVVVVDSGDFFMGTVYDMADMDPVSLKFMQMAGYDAVTLGNHEFDWSPKGLQFLLQNGIGNGFAVPIIATNMETSSASPVDDGIEKLKNDGVIVMNKVLILANGLKIGILGIMGVNADAEAPAALPITFNHSYSFLQEKVDALRNIDGVNIVVLLSHGGITSTGVGEDADIAANVSGINIIASGHYHIATPSPFIRGNSRTIIFSPGEYGEWVSRLDVTYDTQTGKIARNNFTLIPVDDTIRSDTIIEAVMKSYQGVINQFLAPFEYSLDMPISKLEWRMTINEGSESELGNLVADSFRTAASSLAPLNGGDPYHVAVVPNGIIKGAFFPGKTTIISFTDIYNTVPLGKSLDDSQPLLGYPLISIYVTGPDLRNICEAGLTGSTLLGSDYYLNFSGIRVNYNPALASKLQGVQAVYMSPLDDWSTSEQGVPVDFTDSQTLYHVAVDFYSLQLMNQVTRLGLTIIPRDKMGNPISPEEYMAHRIDSGMDVNIQELKEWIALIFYLKNYFPSIPTAVYGYNGSAMGRIHVVN